MNNLIHTKDDGSRVVRLDPSKRVLFLTKDHARIEEQLAGGLDLHMKDIDPAELSGNLGSCDLGESSLAQVCALAFHPLHPQPTLVASGLADRLHRRAGSPVLWLSA